MQKKILLIAWLVSLFFPLSIALAADDYGLNATAKQVPAFNTQTSQDSSYFGSSFLTTKVGQIVGLVLSFIGVIFLILMIYAGILWMTASGNEQQVTKAKGLMMNAIIGMIIVFAAYAITSFIGSEVIK